MVAQFDEARERAEDEDRDDPAVVAHFARITDPHSLIRTLRGMANHNRGLADEADARGDWQTASHLRSRAWAMDDMVDETSLWFAHNTVEEWTEPEQRYDWGDR